MTKYNCIVIDDEPLAIRVIQSHAEKLDSLTIVGSFHNPVEATSFLMNEKTDLMFLDIQMPGMKGTDFLRNLKNPPKTILTTAFREYALESYDLDVIDYLLKPISFERFYKAVNKFLALSQSINNPATVSDKSSGKEYIFLNINKKIYKIFFNEILYIESLRDYITLHTITGKIVVKHTLAAIQENLPESEFIRVHRSFLIAVSHIRRFNSQSVFLGNTEIPVGKNFQSDLFRALKYPELPPSE
jgi:DNA-binding LytR/AlgR family response regulator